MGPILKVAGEEYSGWTSIHVEQSLENIAHSFSLDATDLFPGRPEDWNLALGDECSIELDGEPLVTGYIEDIHINYDGRNHVMKISGREKTADLVDCSFAETENEWKNLDVGAILVRLCAPYGVKVLIDGDLVAGNPIAEAIVKKVPEFKANEGDTVLELVRRLCDSVGVLPCCYGFGKLFIVQGGSRISNDGGKTWEATEDGLVFGKNILEGSITESNRDRFSRYIVKGQGRGTDNKTLADYVEPTGDLDDEVVSRYRPMVIHADLEATTGNCKDRAAWEARIRAARSREITYTLPGWQQSTEQLWYLNALVAVDDPWLGVEGERLISRVSFTLDDDRGSLTHLTVVHPESYRLIPKPIKKTKKGMKGVFDK